MPGTGVSAPYPVSAFHVPFFELTDARFEVGEQFMRAVGYLFALVLALLIGGTALAEEGKGWLGADVLDVTKAEADKLKWDAPHGTHLQNWV